MKTIANAPVLVAGDDPESLRDLGGALGLALAVRGLAVEIAVGEWEALELIARKKFALISLDAGPDAEKKSLETLNRLRAGPGPNRWTPTVIATNRNCRHGALEALSVRNVKFLKKPLDAGSLRIVLDRFLAGHRP
ncbi:MAG: hypothetical protein LBR80_04125 [Deltaproteobacteria bacterium]|jgi:CheY-like chemotaxis protein|nr:hypothetical protein [Deltaproteobacteria bacterium]